MMFNSSGLTSFWSGISVRFSTNALLTWVGKQNAGASASGRCVGAFGVFDLGFADANNVVVAELNLSGQPRSVDQSAVGAAQIADPESIASPTNFGV
jgi:hypothetical protein